jgi:hypothetical protein
MKHGITTGAATILALGLACGGTSTTDTDKSLLATHAPPTKVAGDPRALRPTPPPPPRPTPPPVPRDPQLETARDYFMEGMRAFEAGDYATAIDDFRTAHDAMPRPEILYNVAVCQERLGQPDGALASYRIYLRESAPDLAPERRQEVELKIRALEQQLGLTP